MVLKQGTNKHFNGILIIAILIKISSCRSSFYILLTARLQQGILTPSINSTANQIDFWMLQRSKKKFWLWVMNLHAMHPSMPVPIKLIIVLILNIRYITWIEKYAERKTKSLHWDMGHGLIVILLRILVLRRNVYP